MLRKIKFKKFKKIKMNQNQGISSINSENILMFHSNNEVSSWISFDHVEVYINFSLLPTLEFFKIIDNLLSSKIFVFGNIFFDSVSETDTMNAIGQK